MRGAMLQFWEAGSDPTEEAVAAWRVPGWRVALGVELVAHLEPVFWPERCLVGFCVESEELAGTFVDLIRSENLEARRAMAHPDGAPQSSACDVLLPCRPEAPESEVDNAIVAAVKASHTILCPTNMRSMQPE